MLNSGGDKMCNIGFRYTSDMPNYIVPSVYGDRYLNKLKCDLNVSIALSDKHEE